MFDDEPLKPLHSRAAYDQSRFSGVEGGYAHFVLDVASGARTVTDQKDVVVTLFGASIAVASLALIAIGLLAAAATTGLEHPRLTRSKLQELAIHAFIVFDLAITDVIFALLWLVSSTITDVPPWFVGLREAALTVYYWLVIVAFVANLAVLFYLVNFIVRNVFQIGPRIDHAGRPRRRARER